ncbi:MAG: septum formation initiator family protein [Clostridia bacterium]|nr:septum formation initiator family protein [Oscillospiraceae bacterium]MDY5626594.1 septum formation initiator family protein [Clostridia bacterium]
MRKRKLKKKLSLNKLIALVFLCAAAVILIKQQGEINYYNKKISKLKSDIKTEEKLSKELEEKSAIYSSDYYIEKIARDELGLVMPDEKVFIDANGN